MTEHTTFVIPTERLAAVVAAFSLATGPALAQPTDTAPKPTVGESATPRQDGTTRSGAPRPRPTASTPHNVPRSEQHPKHPPNHKKGATAPRDSDAGSILGTPK